MKFDEMTVSDFMAYFEEKQSRTVLDEELGWVFYPCQNAIEEGLERSMA